MSETEKLNDVYQESLDKVIEAMGDLSEFIHVDDLTDVLYIAPLDTYITRLKNDKFSISGVLFTKFQHGPRTEGVNGITTESLLAICLHRLNRLNVDGFKCQENDEAIKHLEGALASLNLRVERRRKEGTLGTLVPDNGE